MAWWHYPNGDPAPPFRGEFDPEHAIPLLLIVIVLAILLLT